MTRRGSESGVTLVEMLVVVLLLGLAATTVLAGARLGSLFWSRAEQKSADTAEMDALQGMLRHMIAAAYPAFVAADPKDARIAFGGTAHDLTLVAPAPGTQDASRWAVLHLGVEPQGMDRALVLRWRPELPSADENAAPREQRTILLDHVASLDLAYFGAAREADLPDWHSGWADSDRLPAMVRIRIDRNGSTRPAWPELVVQTRVTANVACAYDAVSNTCRRSP